MSQGHIVLEMTPKSSYPMSSFLCTYEVLECLPGAENKVVNKSSEVLAFMGLMFFFYMLIYLRNHKETGLVGLEGRKGTESREVVKKVIWSFVHNYLLLKPHIPRDIFHRTYSGFTCIFFESQELEKSNPVTLILEPNGFIKVGLLEKW